MIYVIHRWWEHFETSETRKIKHLHRVLVPCKPDGDGYLELVTGHESGPGHYAAWIALVVVAARSPIRGALLKLSLIHI